MYITPRTDIRLLKDCPCDPNYLDTLYFQNETAQTAYFMGLTKINLKGYSYQRYAKNVMRVNILADNLYDIDYMMFRNSSYGDKWFYAFVDKVEYINDTTTEIHYHIDDVQTWCTKWVLKQCFIERTHTQRDRVGDNIIPEPLETGEYIYNGDQKMISDFRIGAGHGIIVIAVADNEISMIDPQTMYEGGQICDGIFNGCKLYAYSMTENHWKNINFIINSAVLEGHPDSIISIYMLPSDAVPNEDINSGLPIGHGTKGQTMPKDLGTCGTTIDGHIVRNKKLLTYPYNFVNVNNSDGANMALRYEFFRNGEAKLQIMSTITQPVQVTCVPLNYKKNNNDASIDAIDVDERLTLANYPVCSWSYDAWKAWVAQNAAPLMINAVGAATSLALAAYTPASAVGTGLIGAGGQEIMKQQNASMDFGTNASIYGIHQISNILTNVYKASIAADVCRGNISSGTAMQAHGAYGFWYGRMSVTGQQAEVIDSFFDRYGYAVNKVDTPRLYNRKEWTYIKTIDCSLGGDIPAESKRNIEKIFDNGIRFWVNPSHVGNYGYPNEPFLQ